MADNREFIAGLSMALNSFVEGLESGILRSLRLVICGFVPMSADWIRVSP